MTQEVAEFSGRRGRPRRVAPTSGLEPREEILREAARLFSINGVAGTRITQIADAVGVSSSSVYYHFENIDGIIEALLTYVVEESAAFATAAARQSGPSAERLRALITQHVARLTAGPYDLWFVVGPSQASSTRHPAVWKKAQEWRTAVANVIQEGTRSSEFRSIDPTHAVAEVMGLVYAALQLRHEGNPIEPAQVAELVVAMLSRS
jgi:AcrR family transcriptional regulator